MGDRQTLLDAIHPLRWAAPLFLLLTALPAARGEAFRYVGKVIVEEPTQLDWSYAHFGTSPATPPADATQDASRGGKYSYEFYGPADGDISGAPLVIFVSPQDRPVGWDFFAETCEARGVMFAGVRDAGNGVPEVRRIRAVLEVLSDVRRRYGGRSEQTYLAGFSGGAHVAWRVACALPEQFGGVVCIGYAPQPPQSAWQRVRLAERLSVAVINGQRDSATPWAEDLYVPLLEAYNVRIAEAIIPRQGHTMPPPDAIERAFDWLELDRHARAGDFKRRLGLNIGGAAPREKQSASYLASAKQRLMHADSTPAGLAGLAEVVHRWPDLPAAKEARTLLDDFKQRPDKPWEADQQRQALQVLRIEANGYERLARGSDPSIRSQRAALAANAKQRWELVVKQGDERQQAEATQRLVELEKWIARTPTTDAEAAGVPLANVRFELVGEVTLAEGVERFGDVLAKLGYRLEVDPSAAAVITASDGGKLKLEMPAATYNDVDRRFFRRNGLKLVRKGREVRLLPLEAKAKAAAE